MSDGEEYEPEAQACTDTAYIDGAFFVEENTWPPEMQAAYLMIKAQHIANHEMPAGVMTAAAAAMQRWFERFTEELDEYEVIEETPEDEADAESPD